MAAKEWMCSIVLTDGNIIKIKATEVEWDEIIRMILVHNDGRVVARINMDNVVGWINADYKAEIDVTKTDGYIRTKKKRNEE